MKSSHRAEAPFQKVQRIGLVLILAACAMFLAIALSSCDEEEGGTEPAASSMTMIDVNGQIASDAKSKIKDAGFTDVTFKSDSGKGVWDYDNWTVIGQDPASGTSCEANTPITITVKQTDEIAPAGTDDVSDVVGKSVEEANTILTDKGYTVNYVHAVTGMDYTTEVFADGLPWVVTGYSSLDGEAKTVTLKVDNQENMDRLSDQASATGALSSKLDPVYAWQAVESYGAAEYPYGFDLNWWTDKLAETAEDENTWFLKATCNIKNGFGEKALMTCEARVTGTTDDPQVVDFYVY